MQALLALGLVLGWIGAAQAGPAATYVPGKYENGVYTHPHFVANPDRAGDVKSLLPLEDPAKRKGQSTPEVLNPDALPERPPLSSS